MSIASWSEMDPVTVLSRQPLGTCDYCQALLDESKDDISIMCLPLSLADDVRQNRHAGDHQQDARACG